MKGRRFWMKLAAPGGDVRVYVVAQQPTAGSEVVDAYYDPVKNEIVVWAEGGDNAVKMRFLHEVLHVSFSRHSGDMRETVLGCRSVNGRNKREELIVSFLEPVLYDLLARNKLLKIPRPPKFPKRKDEEEE